MQTPKQAPVAPRRSLRPFPRENGSKICVARLRLSRLIFAESLPPAPLACTAVQSGGNKGPSTAPSLAAQPRVAAADSHAWCCMLLIFYAARVSSPRRAPHTVMHAFEVFARDDWHCATDTRVASGQHPRRRPPDFHKNFLANFFFRSRFIIQLSPFFQRQISYPSHLLSCHWIFRTPAHQNHSIFPPRISCSRVLSCTCSRSRCNPYLRPEIFSKKDDSQRQLEVPLPHTPCLLIARLIQKSTHVPYVPSCTCTPALSLPDPRPARASYFFPEIATATAPPKRPPARNPAPRPAAAGKPPYRPDW